MVRGNRLIGWTARLVGRSGVLTATVLICGVLGSSARSACGQTISGLLIDVGTGVGVEGADVRLLDPSLKPVASGITSSSGSFTLAAPGPGEYLLRVMRIGYDSLTTSRITLLDAQTLHVQVDIETRAIPLEPLTVVAEVQGIQQKDLWSYHQRLERRKSLIGVRLFPRERLAEHSVWTYDEFLRRLAPRISKLGDGCQPVVYLNGKRTNPDPMMSLDGFEGIEFYPGVGPPSATFFNPDACGVILVWTRVYFDTYGIR